MLNITINDWKKWPASAQAMAGTIALFTFEEQVPAAAKADGFKGKELETFLYRPKDAIPAERVILIGLGKRADFSNETLRRAAARAVRLAESLGLSKLALRAPQIARSPAAQRVEFHALAEGLYLGAYRFEKHKTPRRRRPRPLRKLFFGWLDPRRPPKRLLKRRGYTARLRCWRATSSMSRPAG